MQDLPTGFLIINKSAGPTSHDIINQLRRITGIKKIGHAGTLDPFAGGVLFVAVGRESTKKINTFVKMDKEYIADIFLGATSDTHDSTGHIIESKILHPRRISQNLIKLMMTKKFIGEQKQIPPMFSAKKVEGKKLYELARQGITIERKPNKINIYDIKILSYAWPHLKIKIKCSSGTYIRALARDIGKTIGCGAYLETLERTAIGEFKIEESE